MTLPPMKETFAAPEGDVLRIPGARTLRSLTAAIGRNLAARRGSHTKEELRSILKDLLHIGDPVIPYYRVFRPAPAGDLVRCRWGLETEPDTVMSVLSRYMPGWCFFLERACPRLSLRLNAPDAPCTPRPPEEDTLFYDLDVRGFGEMTPAGTDLPEERDFFAPYQFDYHYASGAIMLGAPIFGGRVFDILCTLELLKEEGAEITLEAEGIASVPALAAAVLSDHVTHLKVRGLPESFESMLEDPVSAYPLSCMIPGILKFTDIPELKESIREKLI